MASNESSPKEKTFDAKGLEEGSVVVDAQHTDALIVNASGHIDELDRQYGLISICATALSIDNAWSAFGGGLVVAIYNGGGPGVIFELLVACVWYGFVAASLAELASSIPSSGGVYHWATVCAGKRWGLFLGYVTGMVSFGGWIMDSAVITTNHNHQPILLAVAQIPSNILIQLWSLHHPDYVSQPWQVFVCYILMTWSAVAMVVFGNRLLPALQNLCLFLVTAGLFVTIVVLAAMPKQHASNSFVWSDFQNATGYSGGVAFLTGVLNGAFTIGTPDSVTHLSEEMPNPRRDLPKAIAAQIALGAISSFLYAIALMYAITDLPSILSSPANFPLALVYQQATNGSVAATSGLLIIILLSIWITTVGAIVTSGRIWWALARDGAVPFSPLFKRTSKYLSCPVEATVFCGIVVTAFGAIQIGSKTAFSDLVSAFVLLTTTSYAIPVGAHVLSGRSRVPQGPFWMGRVGYVVNTISVVVTLFFIIMFCFPYALPVTTALMNYTSVILVGYIFLVLCYWLVIRKKYDGPKIAHLEEAGQPVKEII